ncbi:MAG: glucosaminidase domain-containing protein [Saprospiraceae bacterium]|nr:glucosaminidase domain-containing protein [Saprospiraceae bacterium]
MKLFFSVFALCFALSTQLSETHQCDFISLQKSDDTIQVTPDFSKIKIDHAREYVQSIYPFAAQVEKAHRIPAPVTIAIACVESGYGRSYFARTRFNHLGIRVYHEGKPGYRCFKSTEECFNYYSNMFKKERYLPLQEIEGSDLETWVRGLHLCGYNHREKYIKKIMTIINFNNLDELLVT